ncbi:hypothetical protein HDV00_005923 [Rhizophlyctis rosea]|nr:hypothetical protein HDV00_005923 [Rhizophlyctis rosea]
MDIRRHFGKTRSGLTRFRLPQCRVLANCFSCPTRLIIFGGTDQNDVFLNDLHVLNLQTLTWEQPQVLGDLPAAREKHAAVIHEDKLYIVGGSNRTVIEEEESQNTISTVDILDLNTMTWQAPIQFLTRFAHFCFIYLNRLYVYGGLDTNMDRMQDIAFMDLDDHTCTRLLITSTEAPPALGQHFAQVCGNRLAVVLAHDLKQDSHTLATGVWSLELDGLRWRRHEDGDYLTSISWHYYVIDPNDKNFVLFGADERVEDDSFLSVTLTIDLEACGIMYIPPTNVRENWGPLLERDDLTDFTIESVTDGGRQVRVHRLVLCARWPHYNNMVASGMSEATTGVLKLHDTYSSIRAFVRYLYTDSLDGISVEDVTDLLVMANRYCMERLSKLCGEFLHRQLDVENVARVYVRASAAQEKGLLLRAFGMILSRWGQVVKTRGWKELSAEQMGEIWERMDPGARVYWRRDST